MDLNLEFPLRSPGAVLHEGAVVLENSQVLKGEQAGP